MQVNHESGTACTVKLSRRNRFSAPSERSLLPLRSFCLTLFFPLSPLIVIVSAFCGQVLLRIERRSCNPVQLPSSIAHQHTTERVDHSTLSSLSSLASRRTSGGRHRRSPVDIYNRQQSTTAQLSSSRWSQEMRISAAAVGEQHQMVTDPAPRSHAHCVEFAYQHSCRGYATLANGTS